MGDTIIEGGSTNNGPEPFPQPTGITGTHVDGVGDYDWQRLV
jgi:hypothetical protein